MLDATQTAAWSEFVLFKTSALMYYEMCFFIKAYMRFHLKVGFYLSDTFGFEFSLPSFPVLILVALKTQPTPLLHPNFHYIRLKIELFFLNEEPILPICKNMFMVKMCLTSHVFCIKAQMRKWLCY